MAHADTCSSRTSSRRFRALWLRKGRASNKPRETLHAMRPTCLSIYLSNYLCAWTFHLLRVKRGVSVDRYKFTNLLLLSYLLYVDHFEILADLPGLPLPLLPLLSLIPLLLLLVLVLLF